LTWYKIEKGASSKLKKCRFAGLFDILQRRDGSQLGLALRHKFSLLLTSLQYVARSESL